LNSFTDDFEFGWNFHLRMSGKHKLSISRFKYMKKYFVAWSIALVLASAIYVDFYVKIWKTPGRVIQWDVIDYYGYLPAAFIYHDISLKFKDHYTGKRHFVFWAKKTATGSYVFKMTMGLSVMYSPFFFAANEVAGHYGYDPGGYSVPYRFAIVMAALFYLVLGLMFLAKVLRVYFSETVTALTILSIGLGTNLFWYSTIEPGMSHVYSFALVSVFLYLTILWHRRSTILRAILLGLVIGLLTLIRPVNILIALFFLFYDVKSWQDFKNKYLLYRHTFPHLILMVVFGFLMLLPQLLYWKTVTGQWLYYSYGKEGFFFLHPQLINVLFSFRKGWFVYTPVMFFAVVGIYFLFKKYKQLSIAVFLLLLLYLYVVSSWWSWWYGGSLGQRELIDIYPVMALPLAAILSWISSRKPRPAYAVGLLLLFSVLLGAFYNKQYYYGSIHWDSMTRQAYFDSFGRVHPSPRFYKLIKAPDYKDALLGLPEISVKKSKKESTEAVIQRIIKDKKWYQLVKEKAKKRNIPLDSMLILDAKYTLKHEK